MKDDLDIKTFLYELSSLEDIFTPESVFQRDNNDIQYNESLRRTYLKEKNHFVSRNLYACFTSFVALMNALYNVKNRKEQQFEITLPSLNKL